MTEVTTKGKFTVRVTGEQREGFCEQCGTKTEKQFYMDGERKRVQMICPKCGGLGRLIVKTYSVQPPPAPKCVGPKCLWQFVKDVEFCDALATYHNKRVEYATRNRHKAMPEKYRTGEPSPTTIKECLWWTIKLNLVKLLGR